MRIRFHPAALAETKWYEYLIRFFFGGLITAAAGIIASKFGPAIGGLFLAFPAIFPASATLVETHERKRKERHGLSGRKRGRDAASIDAAGAAIASIGLIGFGLIVANALSRFSAGLVLSAATIVWFGLSSLLWMIRKRL